MNNVEVLKEREIGTLTLYLVKENDSYIIYWEEYGDITDSSICSSLYDAEILFEEALNSAITELKYRIEDEEIRIMENGIMQNKIDIMDLKCKDLKIDIYKKCDDYFLYDINSLDNEYYGHAEVQFDDGEFNGRIILFLDNIVMDKGYEYIDLDEYRKDIYDMMKGIAIEDYKNTKSNN